MTTAEAKRDLLEQVRQMTPTEFDRFIEQAMQVRPKPAGRALSAVETDLLKRINRGLPESHRKRFAQLVARRERGELTKEQRREFRQLTDAAEAQDADRAEALVKLAKLRHVPLRSLMKQLGIKARPIHG